MLVNVFESFLGEYRKHNEDTAQISFDCPACSYEKGLPDGDGKGNLEINYNLGKYKCWVCQETNNMYGSLPNLIQRYGLRNSLRDYNLFKPDDDLIDVEYKPIRVKLPETFKHLSECSSKDYKYNEAKSYLAKRGITDEIIKDFNIGYVTSETYYNRIIIPSYDSENKLNYFVGRWFSDQKTKIPYLNTDVEKKQIIFNENKINLDATIYLVEGVFDHISIPNSVPLLGKYISPKLLDLLYDYAMGYIVVLLDSDAKFDAIRLYKELNFGNLRDRIKICIPPQNYDPSRIFEELGKEGIVKLLKTSRKLTKKELD
jgi:hypothetical protein